jgi:hypothetical protein
MNNNIHIYRFKGLGKRIFRDTLILEKAKKIHEIACLIGKQLSQPNSFL